jgi:hypothetical protein
MESLLEILIDRSIVQNPRERKLIHFSRGRSRNINAPKPYKRLSTEIHSADESDLRAVLINSTHTELTQEELMTYCDIFAEVYPPGL